MCLVSCDLIKSNCIVLYCMCCTVIELSCGSSVCRYVCSCMPITFRYLSASNTCSDLYFVFTEYSCIFYCLLRMLSGCLPHFTKPNFVFLCMLLICILLKHMHAVHILSIYDFVIL